MSLREVATLVEVRLAYLVETENGGRFVCFDFLGLNNSYRILGGSYLRLSPPPVDYPIVAGYVRHPRDCVLWASSLEGAESPWGRGLLTVNARYVVEKLFTP